jgi:L-threonylcarbamoyladenylate synthase
MENAIRILKEGGVILHQTDTIWGLACDASNEAAIQKLRNLKGRPDEKGFIILISDIGQLSQYVDKVPDIAWDLVEFAEKPLTVVYPKGKNLPSIAMADDGSVAVRLVKDDHCKMLIYKFKKALVSTSANISGSPSPLSFDQIDSKIKDSVDYILESTNIGSKAQVSTIVKLGLNGDFSFIRK